jgi:hypothetical protein
MANFAVVKHYLSFQALIYLIWMCRGGLGRGDGEEYWRDRKGGGYMKFGEGMERRSLGRRREDSLRGDSVGEGWGEK